MNTEYLEKAKKMVPDVRELILLASKRAEELAKGAPAFVKYEPKMIKSVLDKKSINLMLDPNFIDIALQEIAEGKVTVSYTSVEKKEAGKDGFDAVPGMGADVEQASK